MAYKALYREWRPKTFKDVVGQEHITVTLRNQILSNRIAHAYLFSGTRGTGKTSTAKILAKAVNCTDLKDGEPCNECEMCRKINSGTAIDVIEMDAASKRRLEDIKDVIENVKYPPQEGKYKVYIMDEVHMLTQEAVNAFLKTLEEPPKNVLFILATTDPQKLPSTILSRCQKFDFRRIKSMDIFKRLRYIVDNKGIFSDDKSINLISRMCDGAMRDALSILDQAISMGDGKVEYKNVVDMLGLVTNENLLKLTDSIIEKDIENSMKVIDDIVLSGKDIYNFIKDMIIHFRNLLMVKVSQNPEEVLDMSDENIKLIKEQSQRIRVEEIMRHIRILQDAEEQSKWTKQSRIYLELSVIKMCKVEYDTSKEIILSRLNKLEESIKQGKIKITKQIDNPKAKDLNNINHDTKKTIQKKDNVKVQEIAQENTYSNMTLDIVKKNWKDILESFKSKHQMVLFAALTTGEVENCKNGIITIAYNKNYAFHKQRLEKPENQKIVESIFSDVLKERVSVRYIIDTGEDEISESKEQILKDTFGEDMVEILDE
ncbi:DNA polymerase III subunit gamma/tau [Clostridium tyrobutyricum]|jgi:DNA polymerase-3 subunit gamma/tau|uniref:DNA polymerase III subunit gamma/tau n=1 Tax=Clostridium tyrobutyricum TaxID=1519 RepID=UPI00057EFBF4|nr:DNA polymerase III subunit gamma/tau [Clostridium tyrobutyricum]MBV4441362.1 DNA polymerase III subunit gamma/tau [Clostridium tyrobutyricum]MBV4450654.1 DNA polymerase III subunit gamma/tau [Clostridium tyrobutyricum]MCH4201069.1 DNA polymerase III subunit gamma/tau [Clostridium tyrobutyricum]MCH4238014.1 DNA polymerase III subunit gamma/tau [Clostridium tyrobutyricum]MCH4260284.1 DNA polymerase III subunit gamma/tau [Clostridium tyrobutyricum]